jgi:hypothetical protein
MHSKHRIAALIGSALTIVALNAQAAEQGPSSSQAPYMNAIAPGVEFISILTSGDTIGGYTMAGIPDGMGAYDNADGTFTVLMNHEIYVDPITGPLGIARAHGGKGAFVSAWVIDKRTLKVISGSDLMKNVYRQDASGAWAAVPSSGAWGQTRSFSRFCSADLADRSAFYNSATRKGTPHRIYLNGEEGAPAYQRGLAHVATGPDKGDSYVLPWTVDANGAWENLPANPYSGDKTVVIGNSDGGSNGIYVYVGQKLDKGNDIEKAGLIGGALYRIAVNGNQPETRAADAGLGLTLNARGNYAGRFTLVAGADATNAASTRFLRPEDGAWDRKNRNRYFFVTTDRMDAAKDGDLNTDIDAGQIGRSRLWALDFADSAKPELGGVIEMLLDGTDAKSDYQMLDNMAVNADGTLILQEDVGNNRHNGKIWMFNPADGSMVKLAGFDATLFGDIGANASITKDEESSGVIDITGILGRKDGKAYSLLSAQSHASSGDPETVQGGQLLMMVLPQPFSSDSKQR